MTERIWNDLPGSRVAGGSLKVNAATAVSVAGRRHIDQWTRIAPQRRWSGAVCILISDSLLGVLCYVTVHSVGAGVVCKSLCSGC